MARAQAREQAIKLILARGVGQNNPCYTGDAHTHCIEDEESLCGAQFMCIERKLTNACILGVGLPSRGGQHIITRNHAPTCVHMKICTMCVCVCVT